MAAVRKRLALTFTAFLLFFLLAWMPSFAEDGPVVVRDGVDFESDIIYKNHFSAPNITVTGPDNYEEFRDFNRAYTRVSTVVIIPKHSSDTVEVDYGVVGTVNGQNVVLKLTFSHLVHWPYMNKNSDNMQIYIGDNPTTGFLLDNIYLCKVTYDIRYEDGHLLDNPSLTLDSLNGNQREGAKPINAFKMSLDDRTIMRESGLLPTYPVSGVDPSSILDELSDLDTTKGWWYDDGRLAPGETYIEAGDDYIYNPLTGKVDKYNPRTAITCFYENSSNMQAWITARNGGVWESALIVAKEPEHNLTIKKETNVSSDQEFTFRLNIYREIEKEETVIDDEEEPEGAAYAVFDSSDKTLTFFRDKEGKYKNAQVDGTKTYYTSFENKSYSSSSAIPWNSKRSAVEKIVFEDEIIPSHTSYWFQGMSKLTSVEQTENLKMHKAITAMAMFSGCTQLEELDTSSFYTPNLQRCGSMFYNCSKLKYLDLSNMDFRYSYYVPPLYTTTEYGLSGFTDMFYGCSNLTTEIILPVIPNNHTTPFEKAATEEGAEIKFKIWIARPLGQEVVNNRSIGTIEELMQGVNGNVVFDGFVDEMYFAPVPDYIGEDHVIHKTEKHIFDLTGDERFEYHLDTHTYTFKVKAGESLTIPNIPKSYKYEVEEVDIPDGWELVSASDNTSGSMDKDEEVVFRNKIPSLTIRKKTAGNEEGEFDFKIKVWKGDTQFDLSSDFGQPDDDGYYHFKLSNGGVKSIPEIPAGYQYEIKEEKKDGWKLTKKTNDTGTFESYVTAEFTNRSLHTLKVKKTVDGASGDKNKDFEFSIKVYDDDENMDLTKYLSEHGGKYNKDDGSYSFTLKHGEEVEIPDVPYGYKYEIEETDYADEGYSTKVNDKAARKAAGTVDEDKEYTFTNTNSTEPQDMPSLTINKITAGNEAGEFEFKIKVWKGDTQFDLSSDLGQPDDDGYYHFKLSNAGEKTIPEIPVGYKYEIIELEQDGWKLTEETNATGTIEEDITAEFTNRSLHTLKVKKTVDGASGDKNKDFEFNIKVYDDDENMDLAEYLSEHGGKYNEDDGSYSFTLKHGEEVEIPDVPYGYKYEIEETDYADEGYSTKVNDKAARNAAGTVGADKKYTFTNTNPAEPHDIPSLTINKMTVDDIAGEFEFKIKVWKGDTQFDLSSVLGQPDDDGYYHFKLSNDDEITIPEVPAGYQYEIIELEQDGWELTEETNDAGTIEEDITAEFTNRSLHTLKVKKTVDGASGDKNKDFEFSIKVYDDDENMDLTEYLSEHGGKYNEDDGSYSFTLKHGEEVEIPDVPYGYKYEIEETDYADEGYSTKVNDKAARNAAGTVGADKEYAFTNTKSEEPQDMPSLKIKKKTAGNVAGEFEFKIKVWKGDTQFDLSSDLGQPDDDGYYHFKLSSGGVKTISEVPVGYQYEIIELEQDGWELTEKTNDTGTIEADVTAEFTNLSLHTLKVEKTVAGASGDKNKDFEFNIKVYDDDENMDLTEYLSEHGGKYNEDDGSYSFTLKHGEEVEIPDIPYGYKYEIEENDYSDDGYSTKVNDNAGRTASGEVDSDKEFTFTNTSPADPDDPDDPDDSSKISEPQTPSSSGNNRRPGTGDDSSVVAWASIMMACIMLLTGILMNRRRNGR